MSVNEKMTAIADAIRSKTGGTEPLGLDDMAVGVGDVYEAGKQEILAEQFKTTFWGNGTFDFAIEMPFEPDVFCIFSPSDYLNFTPNTLRSITVDMKSVYRYMGVLARVTAAGAANNSSLTTANFMNSFVYEDGVLHFRTTSSALLDSKWQANTLYCMTAAKYNRDIKAIVEEEVRRLPDDSGGTMSYTRSRVMEYFTESEWAELIATKPNWTFSML